MGEGTTRRAARLAVFDAPPEGGECVAVAPAPERDHRFAYRNHKKEVAMRTVRGPYRLWFGSTTFHPTPCLLLDAYDVEKAAQRTYKVADILSVWTEVTP